MKIGHVNLDEDVLLIAEIGNNHEGDLKLAHKLIKLAADAGAQAVKFQTIRPEELVAASEIDRIKQLKRFSLSQNEHEELARTADKYNVMFMSSPFYIDAIDWLNNLVPTFKIASGDNNFQPLLEKIAGTGKPIILSTGMSTLNNIENSASIINEIWANRNLSPGLILLHCVSAYPAPLDEINLSAMNELKGLCDHIGYSDHTLGIDTAIYSVVAGARVVEKHFTIDKNYSDFRDHQLSADPDELRTLADKINEVSKILGNNKKEITKSEKEVAALARRSIVASHDILENHILSAQDFDYLRPANGLPPNKLNEIIGRATNRIILKGQLITLDLLN